MFDELIMTETLIEIRHVSRICTYILYIQLNYRFPIYNFFLSDSTKQKHLNLLVSTFEKINSINKLNKKFL